MAFFFSGMLSHNKKSPQTQKPAWQRVFVYRGVGKYIKLGIAYSDAGHSKWAVCALQDVLYPFFFSCQTIFLQFALNSHFTFCSKLYIINTARFFPSFFDVCTIFTTIKLYFQKFLWIPTYFKRRPSAWTI